ncbi:O-acetyl-ADP-ribose deacetylase (regulator of RNase III), contains Macro domain [Butyrivibrio sp. ob235]|uniref:macro domain-containing protein n=1 Tax=Butyrivibrio sp. ob235 TaxID=1761780 RepID=UPI0008AF0A1F|nr:macro domain-containing protein [Butyrivibrio sp. ob235]SEM22062.1 O-acetyl-ADP-ribose deacetylase (regulator of RNase III), contains Macro domain [Butyrivibrio sp. ob235]
MPFQIIRNDITKVKADAIVNTANPKVAIGSGVDTAIYNVAGRERLFAERKKIGIIERGDVAITPAFDLNAKYIIHAVGCWWEGGDQGEAELLRKCYDKSLALAAEKKCKSIAFPVMATGCYGFPPEVGMEIAVDAFTGFLEEHDMEIFLVVFDKGAVKVSGELGEEVRSFIDDEYVTCAFDDEYAEKGLPEGLYDDSESLESFSEEPDADTVGSLPDTLCPSDLARRRAEEVPDREICDAPLYHGMLYEGALSKKKKKAQKTDSLDDVLKDIYTDSFEKHLRQLINKKGLKNSEVYAAANINKQYFSKLLNGKVKPSKEKVLALAVGLHLNMDETIDFLGLAGYALSPISQTDAVVRYFIEHENYNVIKIDMVLFDYGLDPLSKETK